MKILSVNAGSSSLKFTLFEMPEGIELIGGYFEKIGLSDSFYSIKLSFYMVYSLIIDSSISFINSVEHFKLGK